MKQIRPLRSTAIWKILSLLRVDGGMPHLGSNVRIFQMAFEINSHLEDSLVTSQMGHTSIDTTKKYYYYDNIEDDYKKDLIMQAVSF